MRCWIELDGSALRHNIAVFQKLTAPAQVIPVIKSNAYGHGLSEVYNALRELSPPWLAVNYISEAESLRSFGYEGRIMVVGPLQKNKLGKAKELELDIFLVETGILEDWISTTPTLRPRAHLKIDTGMSRQGFLPEQVENLVERLGPHKEGLVGICSHFANVEDVLEQSYALQQLKRFEEAFHKFESSGFQLIPHIAASSSALLMEASRFALVRIGISAYGLWPSRTTQLSFLQHSGNMIELKPALSWRTEVAIVKSVRAGQFIGYGCSYKALRDMNIAVLPVGYFEGYPRLASNRAYVLMKGQRCPVVGRVCMNMMMIDISHLENIRPGTHVTLIGADGDERLEASQIAEWSDTIHYEIVTKLNPDIPRVLK